METISNFLTNDILLIFIIGIILIIWSIIIVKYVSSYPYQHLRNEFKNFKGFPLKNIPLNNNDNAKTINRSENSHMLVYGQSGSGKTTFIKHYIKNINVLIFTLPFDDWPCTWCPVTPVASVTGVPAVVGAGFARLCLSGPTELHDVPVEDIVVRESLKITTAQYHSGKTSSKMTYKSQEEKETEPSI